MENINNISEEEAKNAEKAAKEREVLDYLNSITIYSAEEETKNAEIISEEEAKNAEKADKEREVLDYLNSITTYSAEEERHTFWGNEYSQEYLKSGVAYDFDSDGSVDFIYEVEGIKESKISWINDTLSVVSNIMVNENWITTNSIFSRTSEMTTRETVEFFA